MNLKIQEIKKKIKTQPINSQSLPKLQKINLKQQNLKINLKNLNSTINQRFINPQLILRKTSINLQASRKRISSFFLNEQNKESPNNNKKKLIPYQIAANNKQYLKSTGLKNQKQTVLDQNNQIHITAQKWLIYDCQKGQVIKGFKYKKQHDIASISKILTFYTAFMIVKQFKLTMDKTQLLVMKQDQIIQGTKINLKEQSIVTLENMLYAMMLNSANNAATVIANNLGHLVMVRKKGKYFSCFDLNSQNRKTNIDYFVSLMQDYAKKFELDNTKIKNPNGMANNISSCLNVAQFFQACWKLPIFRKISATKEKKIHQNIIDQEGKIQKVQINLKNTNNLLFKNNSCLGGKTGENKVGGNGFVGLFEIEQCNVMNKYILVVLGCFAREQKFRDIEKLYQWLKKSKK